MGSAEDFLARELRNCVRQDQVTCVVCTGPSPGRDRCRTCQGHQRTDGLADATGFLVYAVAGRPSGRLMRGYKADPPREQDRAVVAGLVAGAVGNHAGCAAAGGGLPITHWSVVPSLPARPGPHPLRHIVAPVAAWPESKLTAASRSDLPRTLSRHHYQAAGPLPAGAHVLLIDDTWVTGGHAQSAALALRAAGAARVSLLVVARWLTREPAASQRLLRDIRRHPYDPAHCPWTGDRCPGGAHRGWP